VKCAKADTEDTEQGSAWCAICLLTVKEKMLVCSCNSARDIHRNDVEMVIYVPSLSRIGACTMKALWNRREHERKCTIRLRWPAIRTIYRRDMTGFATSRTISSCVL
jgi:hypothetical protein